MTQPAQQRLERLHVTALDEILGQPFTVLDDGFVRVVDYMGSDAAIVQAARVSYGAGTRRVHEDRGLIRYLMRHRHTTPFEMCEIKLHVRVPMDCWRQWIRHRSACLAGDAQLYFDEPAAITKGKRKRMGRTIADFHRLWHAGTYHSVQKKKPLFCERIEATRDYTIAELATLVERRAESLRTLVAQGTLAARRIRVSNPQHPSIIVRGKDWITYAHTVFSVRSPLRDRLARRHLRMCDEATGEILHTTVTDVWESGVKPVFKVTLDNGYSLTMTQDHQCLTQAGWQTLAEATQLRLTDARTVTWSLDAPAFAVNGAPAHTDGEWLRTQKEAGLSVQAIADRAGVSYHTIRKALKRFGLEFSEREKARLRGLIQRGRKRPATGPRHISPAGMARLRAARTGTASNFWKGGTSSERELIGRWTSDHAQHTHRRFRFSCALCGQNDRLHAHHVDPVWHNPDRARDPHNLMSLCTPCHKRLHAANLELELLEAVVHQRDLQTFWQQMPSAAQRPSQKRLPTPTRLVRTWARIRQIEYLGEQMTYDLSVAGPYHNFVANGFIVHNSVNEYSTRYSVAIDAAQSTVADAWRLQATNNRQGSGGFLDVTTGQNLSEREAAFQHLAREVYEERLAHGIAREQARKDLPLSTYTEAYWKIDLHNLLHFLGLRMDEHAQAEIRAYAEVIGTTIVQRWCPLAWEAFVDYQRQSLTLSRLERDIIRALVQGDNAEALMLARAAGLVPPAGAALTRNRERDELAAKLTALGLPLPWADRGEKLDH